jgi:hypothetical protein
MEEVMDLMNAIGSTTTSNGASQLAGAGDRAFQANARTITASDQLLQELINMVR